MAVQASGPHHKLASADCYTKWGCRKGVNEMRIEIAAALFVCLSLTGCRQATQVRAPSQVRLDLPEPLVTEGSLWQPSAQRHGLIADNIARARGDLLTVLVIEDTNAKRDRSTSTNRSQDVDASVDTVTSNSKDFLRLNGQLPALKAQSKRSYQGGGTIEDNGQVRATLSAQVTDVLANGNLIVLGQKEVVVGGESQIVTLTGIVRPQDVRPDNTVASTQIAEARIHISGSGPLNNAQRLTLVSRFFDWVNLF